MSRRQAAALSVAKSGESFPPLRASLPKRILAAQRQPVAGAGDLASYAGAVKRGMASRDLSGYLGMLAHPFDRQRATRYPDETIVPTGMTHLASSISWTNPSTKPFVTMLNQKAIVAQPTLLGFPAGTINPPVNWTPGGVPADLYAGGYADYGAAQKLWTSLSVADRTLAYAIRARVTGLPASTFLPSGTLYFLQLQQHDMEASTGSSTLFPQLGLSTAEDIVQNGESACIRAVEAGKGFSVTVNELSRDSGLHIPYLPQGPMSYVFSDTNAYGAQKAGQGDGTSYAPGQPAAYSYALSGPVSASTILLVVGFGLQVGMELRFDYAHQIEYIPNSGAAGLVETETKLPSQPTRESIAQGAHALATSIHGSTNATQVRSSLQNFIVGATKGYNLGKSIWDTLKSGPIGSAMMPAVRAIMKSALI